MPLVIVSNKHVFSGLKYKTRVLYLRHIIFFMVCETKTHRVVPSLFLMRVDLLQSEMTEGIVVSNTNIATFIKD